MGCKSWVVSALLPSFGQRCIPLLAFLCGVGWAVSMLPPPSGSPHRRERLILLKVASSHKGEEVPEGEHG